MIGKSESVRLGTYVESDPLHTALPPRPHMVRCSCDHCGAHVLAVVSWRVNGVCGNCGGYELTPLEVEPLRSAGAPKLTPTVL
jgi:hypothetical protein